MIKKIIFTLIISIFISVYFCQNQAFVKNALQKYLQEVPAFKDAYLDCDISELNVFFPTIRINNLIVCDKDKEWHWCCKQLKVSFSWINLIFFKKLNLRIKINEWETYSYFDSEIKIINHLKKFIGQQKLPIELSEVNFKNCTTTLKNKKNNLTIKANWSNQSRELHKEIKSTFYFFDGYLRYQKKKEFTDLNGTIHSIFSLNRSDKNKASLNLTFHAPLIKAKRCFLSGNINNQKSQFKISNINGLVVIDPLIINQDNFYLKAQFPLKYCKRLLDKKYYKLCKQSYCKSTLSGKASLKEVSGKISLHQLSILKKLLIKFKKDKDISGYISLLLNPLQEENPNVINGEFKFQSPNQGTVSLYNNENISIRNYKIDKDKFKLTSTINTWHNINTEYSAKISNNFDNQDIETSGKIKYNRESIDLSGHICNFQYESNINLFPKLDIQKFYLFENNNKILEIFSTKKSEEIRTNIDYSFLKNILPKPINEILEGKGTLKLTGNFDNNGKIKGKLELNNGTILLPNLYNAIKNFSCQITINKKHIKIKDLKIELYKGEINCTKGKVILGDLDSSPNFVFLPLNFKDVFFSFKKNITTSITGNLILIKNGNKNKIIGNLTMNKCKLNLEKSQNNKSNILNNTELDITIINKQPVKLQTKQLECKTEGYIKINKKEESQKLSGNIQILSGIVKFPYKNLYIVDGHIHLVPSNQLIEITAKGTIKGYNLTVQIEGPIKKPNISLESNPNLSEEQIGSLLITGSQNTSLNILAPSFLMQNLQNILIDSSRNSDNILKPLKHIRLISNLKDQQGLMGGLTGGVEIDFNDRLHATIQKDLNTSDETRLELDYQISDDMNIRGTKDEHGDISGELEMRWKF